MADLVGFYDRDRYEFRTPGGEVEIVMNRISSGSRSGITAEVDVLWTLPPRNGLLKSSSMNLLADRTIKSWATELAGRIPDVDWYKLLTTAAYMAKEHYRHGDPPIDLMAIPARERSRWLLRPILEDGPNLIAAKGGSGKSLLALAVAASYATGRGKFLGLNPTGQGPVFYLDYEANPHEHASRAAALAAGSGVPIPEGALHYSFAAAPLHEIADSLVTHIRRLGIGLVVVDSKGAAIGGAPEEAEATLRFFAALRRLGVASLIVDHVTNERAAGKGAKRPFGSVYAWNLSRNVWWGDKVGPMVVLEHVKSNNGRIGDRLAWMLGVEQEADGSWRSVQFTPTSARPVHEDEQATTAEKLHEALAGAAVAQSFLTTSELAELVGVDAKQVRSRLAEIPGVRNVAHPGAEGRWVLESDNGLPDPF